MDCKVPYLSALLPLLLLSLACVPSSTVANKVETRATAPNWLSVVPNHWMCAGDRAPVYFVHDTDCSRYYECVCEDAYEYACEKGLRFNAQTLRCDQPSHVSCPGGSGDPSIVQPSVSTDGPVADPAEDPRCPSKQANQYWADESNCSKYYQCVRGQVVELTCPESLVWDNAAKKCSVPNPNKCCAPVPAAPVLEEEESLGLWGRIQSWMG
ncbi:probable chitinase 10 isoform X1 [Anopheles stephensi]|uniref:probable chitinase 10 isoform X1 n=1 Tax=Anopheles stephensi TaxID=30069 RepID=UPI001658BD1E|nr:probable chitinase 10 isoform X1 [Anopheles stephensi]